MLSKIGIPFLWFFLTVYLLFKYFDSIFSVKVKFNSKNRVEMKPGWVLSKINSF